MVTHPKTKDLKISFTDFPVIEKKERYEYKNIKGVNEGFPLDFHGPYGCSKGAADQYVRDYARVFDLPAVVLRMSCIAGPRPTMPQNSSRWARSLSMARTSRR